MRLSTDIIKRIYRLEAERSPLLDRTLQLASKSLYREVERVACHGDGSTRKFRTGGTPALKTAIDAMTRFVSEYDKTGTVSMITFDSVIWACHNNGTLADKFIDVGSESEAIAFLNELSGTYRH